MIKHLDENIQATRRKEIQFLLHLNHFTCVLNFFSLTSTTTVFRFTLLCILVYIVISMYLKQFNYQNSIRLICVELLGFYQRTPGYCVFICIK